MKTLLVNEIFLSIQGESTFAGLPFVFVRLTGCSLRCSYCDTQYAFYEGESLAIEDIITKVQSYKISHVLITGGEPLDQKNCKYLIEALLLHNMKVLVETAGNHNIRNYPKQAHYIIDIKTPSSNMKDSFNLGNFSELSDKDELKFVIGDKKDYEYAKTIINKNQLSLKTIILFTPVFDRIKPELLASWILADKLNVRFQLQLHKYIWDPDTQGV